MIFGAKSVTVLNENCAKENFISTREELNIFLEESTNIPRTGN